MATTGNKFLKGLVMPLPPEAVFFTIQSGWAADAVLFATAGSINGLRNQTATIEGVSPPDPDFLRALELLRKIQLSGAVALQVQQDEKKQQTTLVTFRSTSLSEETLAEIRELRRLLRLNPEATEFKLVFAANASNDKEVAVITRSIMHIMGNMAAQVEVPEEHVREGRAMPGWETAVGSSEKPHLVRIRCTKGKPSDPFAAVWYRNHWFWIDDQDLQTKRAFAFMMMLFTLADSGERESLPLITIPAQ